MPIEVEDHPLEAPEMLKFAINTIDAHLAKQPSQDLEALLNKMRESYMNHEVLVRIQQERITQLQMTSGSLLTVAEDLFDLVSEDYDPDLDSDGAVDDLLKITQHTIALAKSEAHVIPADPTSFTLDIPDIVAEAIDLQERLHDAEFGLFTLEAQEPGQSVFVLVEVETGDGSSHEWIPARVIDTAVLAQLPGQKEIGVFPSDQWSPFNPHEEAGLQPLDDVPDTDDPTSN